MNILKILLFILILFKIDLSFAVEKDKPKEKNLWEIYISGFMGLGYGDNSGQKQWTDEQTINYLDFLKRKDAQYNEYTIGGDDTSYTTTHLGLETRIISFYGIGFGFQCGLSNVQIIERDIKNEFNSDHFRVETKSRYFYYGISVYYQLTKPFGHTFINYLIFGLGLNRCSFEYSNSIVDTTTDSNASNGYDNAPYSNYFTRDYREKTFGYQGLVEAGHQISIFYFGMGIMNQYVKIKEFKSGNVVMKYNNGENVTAEVNTTFLYLTAGLYF